MFREYSASIDVETSRFETDIVHFFPKNLSLLSVESPHSQSMQHTHEVRQEALNIILLMEAFIAIAVTIEFYRKRLKNKHQEKVWKTYLR